VPDLGPQDFVVREDNLAREVLKVERATAPMQVALLVDNSTGATQIVRDIREAASAFITGMTAGGNKNEVAIIGLAERPTILADYTTDSKKLANGVGRIFTMPQSGLYILDAIIEISNGLKKREAARPVMVMVTTEGPELSNRYRDQALTALKGSGAALHIVVLGPPGGNISTTEARERAFVFDEGTRVSGGRYDNVLVANALPGRLKQVADGLTHQYLVTYSRPQSLIPPEKITVSSPRPGHVARGTPVKEASEQRKP
jgi:hypothetical protein